MRKPIFLVLLTLCVCSVVGCSGKTKRIAPDELSDSEVGAELTSQDIRSVSQRLGRSLITLPQIQNVQGESPKVALLPVENRSDFYLDADMITGKMRTELIKHAQGRIVFIDKSILEAIKKENKDKERGKLTGSGETVPYGADFFLTGTIASLEKVAGAGQTIYWRLSFRLVDAGTSALIWEDEYEIKKYSTTGLMNQ